MGSGGIILPLVIVSCGKRYLTMTYKDTSVIVSVHKAYNAKFIKSLSTVFKVCKDIISFPLFFSILESLTSTSPHPRNSIGYQQFKDVLWRHRYDVNSYVGLYYPRGLSSLLVLVFIVYSKASK